MVAQKVIPPNRGRFVFVNLAVDAFRNILIPPMQDIEIARSSLRVDD